MKFGKFLQQQVSPEFKEDPVFAGFYSSMIHIASRLSSTHSHAKETEERHDAAIDEVTSYHKSLPWHFVVQHGSNSQNGELMTQVLKQENLRANACVTPATPAASGTNSGAQNSGDQ